MTEPYIVTGSYVVQREHALQDSPLDRALELMEGSALRFSLDTMSDEKTRASYIKNIRRMSQQTRDDVKAGKITAREGVKFSHEMRNKIMVEHRKFTSALATYQILNAENKPKEAARQGIIVGAGAFGGVLAGLGVSAFCGPGAPICVIAVVLAGTIAGGVAGEAVAS